jgi:hypothetical protein
LDQVCISADGPVTSPTGGGATHITDHSGQKWSLSDRLRRAAGDALKSQITILYEYNFWTKSLACEISLHVEMD